MSPIEQAIQIAGSQQKLAALIGVTQAAVSKWALGGAIHMRHFDAIVSASNGEVSREMLFKSEHEKHQQKNS